MTRKPVAVLTADVHYNPTTLPLADAAMRQAISRANDLGVPFIVAGDLHDTKALLRGECVNAMIETFKTCKTKAYVIVGNHCKINEKGEDHSLKFLQPYVRDVINSPTLTEIKINGGLLHMLPYHSDVEELRKVLNSWVVLKGSTIIMHQGLNGVMSHYIQDKSALNPEDVQDFRVISGHYHKAQDIKTGRPRKGAVGLFSYIGNPYSLNFGEANDGPKGFQVLYDDGLMEQVPTNLRKHVVVETDVYKDSFWKSSPVQYLNPGDLLWLKVKGPQSELKKLNKREIGQRLLGHSNFKLDLIPTEAEALEENAADAVLDTEVLDALISALPESEEQKTYLKSLWKEIL